MIQLRLSICIFINFCALLSHAQTLPDWHVTPAPFALNRYEDMTFLNSQLGWAVDFGGAILKTTDGGNSWQTLNGPIGDNFRRR